MGKSFQSDRRLERKRHRDQRDAYLSGKEVKGMGIPWSRQQNLSRHRENLFQERIQRERSAFDQQVRQERSRIEMTYMSEAQRDLERTLGFAARYGGYSSNLRRLAEAYQDVGDRLDTVADDFAAAYHNMLDDWRNAAKRQQDKRDREIRGRVKELLSPHGMEEYASSDYGLFDRPEALIEADRVLICLALPINIFGSLGEESDDAVLALYRLANDAGIEFLEALTPYGNECDFVLRFGPALTTRELTFESFMRLCIDRMGSPFVVRRYLAAQAIAPVKRKLKLED